MHLTRAVVAQICVAVSLLAGPARNPKSFQALDPAIKAGDGASVMTLLDQGADVNAPQVDGTTPLMTAVLYANAPMVKLLLDRGADPNKANKAGATALAWGAGDAQKARLLVARGADVNARTKDGRTPLHVAAMVDGGYDIVKLLIDKGAQADPKDENGATPLMEAARSYDTRTARLLLELSADVNAKDRGGRTALLTAVMNKNLAGAKLLLKYGADPNTAAFFGVPALHIAVVNDDLATFRLLASKGADVNRPDAYGNTALIWSAFSERGDPQITSELLKAGVDVNAKNKHGETALDAAKKRGQTPLLAMLKEAGGKEAAQKGPQTITLPAEPPTPKVAVERALSVLMKGAAGFSQKAPCSSCHNQTLPVMAVAAARQKGIQVDTAALDAQTAFSKKAFSPGSEKLLQGIEFIPDLPVTGSYTLIGLAAAGYPSDKMTTAAVQHLAYRQHPDGHWETFVPRPPMEQSDITATALSMRALQLYGPEGRAGEFRQRIEKAREWLKSARPFSSEEYSMQLMGLVWSKAPEEDIRRVARLLLAKQRKDGGWAQIPTLPSDAYATGQALAALNIAGEVYISTSAYEKGIEYLLRTQHQDGSWLVESRAFPFQPYFESGFPHGHNQWISSAATAWAAIAITASVEPAGQSQFAASRRSSNGVR